LPSRSRAFFGNAPIKLIAVILFAILVPSVLVTGLGLVAVFQAEDFVEDRFGRPVKVRAESLHARLAEEWARRLSLYGEVFRSGHKRGSHLAQLRTRDPCVRDVLVSGPGALEALPEPPLPELWPPAAGGELKELNRLENREKDYARALEECRRVLAADPEDAVCVEAVLAAARLSRRLGAREDEVRYLRMALERFGETVDATGVVRAVPILWRLVEVERELQYPRSRETLQDFALALSRHGARMPSEVTAHYRERLASSGDPAITDAPVRAAAAESSSRRLRTESLASLDAALQRARGPGAFTLTHTFLPDSGEVDIASFPTETGGMTYHLVLDRNAFFDEARLLCAEFDLPVHGLEFISGAEPRAPGSSASGRWLFARRLPPPLENIEMRYVSVEGLLPLGFRGFDVISLATFTWAVILLVLAIVFGALFTVRIVLREMRTARLKSDFVSFITHELKTPLTAIRMLTETILSGKTENEEENRLCTQMIENESLRLSKLVDQVLEYSKIERRQKEFRFASCDMEDVVRQAVRIFGEHNRFDPREIEVNSAQHISKISMDREAMIELFLNLLSNAAKYSTRDKKIVINLRESIDEITVDVVDHGAGIRKRDQKKIFERFYRAEDYLTREVEGTGLGLTFARYIARVHNGEIKVSSQVNAGSTFTLQLRKNHVLAE
jgi:signal transduction histidine kinase